MTSSIPWRRRLPGMVRRSPWINPKAQLLVRLLAERYGLTLTEDAARETISDRHLRAV